MFFNEKKKNRKIFTKKKLIYDEKNITLNYLDGF